MISSDDNIPLRPIAEPETVKIKARSEKALHFPKLSLWAQIIGAGLVIFSIVWAVRGMFGDFPLQGSNHALAEHFSTILLFSFLGSFGLVPGLLLFWWGRALRRKPNNRIIAILPFVFSMPFWGLAIFMLLNSGMSYGIIALFFAACLSLIGLYVWRRQPKNLPTET